MVGTRGVPARYGGFETAVEEVGSRLAARGHDVVVYCRTAPEQARPAEHLGMRLVHLPAARKRSLETLSHSALSIAHLLAHRTDAAFVFNAANSPLLPALRMARIPVATHVDGLEWKRAKWGGAGRRYYRMAESLAVRWSDALIADAEGIAEYYDREFGAPTELLRYGAPLIAPGANRLSELGLEPRAARVGDQAARREGDVVGRAVHRRAEAEESGAQHGQDQAGERHGDAQKPPRHDPAPPAEHAVELQPGAHERDDDDQLGRLLDDEEVLLRAADAAGAAPTVMAAAASTGAASSSARRRLVPASMPLPSRGCGIFYTRPTKGVQSGHPG